MMSGFHRDRKLGSFRIPLLQQTVGQVPDLPSAADAYPAKSGSLATPEKNAKGTQDKIGFVPQSLCIPCRPARYHFS